MALNGNTSTAIPKTMKAWSVEGTNGFDSLTFHAEAPLPEPSDYEVLVKFHAVSLNYRDLLIPKGQCLSYLVVPIIFTDRRLTDYSLPHSLASPFACPFNRPSPLSSIPLPIVNKLTLPQP
jgi:hypothetical protein